jgi:N-acetylneuraminic acid mutarotase
MYHASYNIESQLDWSLVAYNDHLFPFFYHKIYDPTTDSWTTKNGLPEQRQRGGAAAVVVGRKIYVSHGNRGGHETGNFSTSLAWLDYYDIDEDRWYTNLPDAPNPRDHTGGALVNGRICVAGGRDGGSIGFFDKVILPTDCYDLERKTWSVEANIPQGRAGSLYGTSCDGKLIVAGGEGFNKAWSNVDVFDGSSWTTLDNLNVARHGTGLAVDCACNQIHVASGAGSQGGGKEIASVETYFPSGVDVNCNV